MAIKFNHIYPQGLFRGGIAISGLSSRLQSSFKKITPYRNNLFFKIPRFSEYVGTVSRHGYSPYP
ncbi:hypothetical protein GGR07_001789 [Bacteroides pyogenes]|nr:hypothetical protein [Bacteroides pyogenes]SUV32919.1 Uncharacterised protein [Bacteroides pyogenes]